MQNNRRTSVATVAMAIGATVFLLAGCSSNEPLPEPVVRTPTSVVMPPAPTGTQAAAATVQPETMTSGTSLSELKDPKSVLSKRSIYFDFDSFIVKNEFRSLVEAHAHYLAKNPKTKMLIQGNADERGSREYNLALGQKRAEALKRALVLLGAKEEQVEAVSLGEEKPKNAAHDEAAWAENRRDDMLYLGEF